MAFVPCVLRPRYYSGGPSASVPDPLLLPELSKLSFSPFALLPPLAPYKCWPYTLLGPPLLLGPLAGSADPSPSDRPLDVYTPWTEPLRSLPPPSGGEGVGAPPCEDLAPFCVPPAPRLLPPYHPPARKASPQIRPAKIRPSALGSCIFFPVPIADASPVYWFGAPPSPGTPSYIPHTSLQPPLSVSQTCHRTPSTLLPHPQHPHQCALRAHNTVCAVSCACPFL